MFSGTCGTVSWQVTSTLLPFYGHKESILQHCNILCTYHSTIIYSTLLYYTLLYFTLLYSTLLYYNLLYFNLLYSTLLYYALLYFTLLYSTQLQVNRLHQFFLQGGQFKIPHTGNTESLDVCG